MFELVLMLFPAFSSLSESFFMVKGAALFLQQGGATQGPKTPTHHKNAGGPTYTHNKPCFFLLLGRILCTFELQTKKKKPHIETVFPGGFLLRVNFSVNTLSLT